MVWFENSWCSSMCVCLKVCMFSRSMHARVCLCMYVSVWKFVCLSVRVCICMSLFLCVCLYVFPYVFVSQCLCVSMFCLFIYVNVNNVQMFSTKTFLLSVLFLLTRKTWNVGSSQCNAAQNQHLGGPSFQCLFLLLVYNYYSY